MFSIKHKHNTPNIHADTHTRAHTHRYRPTTCAHTEHTAIKRRACVCVCVCVCVFCVVYTDALIFAYAALCSYTPVRTRMCIQVFVLCVESLIELFSVIVLRSAAQECL